jgi:acetolactate synthase-1/2/3 large subunit
MNLQELATLKSQNLPVRLFIINNNGYASIRSTQRNYFQGRFVATGPESGLYVPDTVALAQSIGIPASRVSDASELREAVRRTLAQTGPVILDVQVQQDEVLWPKSAALPQPDGSMLSMPLEDMSPLLPRDELREQMLVPLAPESERVQN